MGSQTDDTEDQPATGPTTARGTFVPTSSETLIERVVTKYLASIVDDRGVQLGQIRDALLQRINGELSIENRSRKRVQQQLPAPGEAPGTRRDDRRAHPARPTPHRGG